MKMEALIKERNKIEVAYQRGIITREQFAEMTLVLCDNCSKATQEICGKDGPCCDVVIRRVP